MPRGDVAAIVALTAMLFGQAPTQQQPPTFRTNTSIVPIDVRVVDKDGKAVTDLTRADFSVTEDGVPQTITQFEKDAVDGDVPPHRAFAIVLGDGRIQTPFKSVDALIDFVRGLGPNDVVGVMAYNRWAEFTADHGASAALLERYKAQNGAIETARETARPPYYIHGPAEITPEIQALIDGLFASGAGDLRESLPSGSSDLSFSDVVHMYRAIASLAPMEGERHLILLSEQGDGLIASSSSVPTRLATTAADARVALHVVQTGGYGARQSVLPPDLLENTHDAMQHLGIVGIPTSSTDTRGGRETAAATGGLAFFYTQPRSALDRIAHAISMDYLLGYVPENAKWDGGYRRIEVRVSRPGVTVIYRHGYHATRVLPAWDGRIAMTDARLAEARSAARPLGGLTLQLNAKPPKTASDAIDVELKIDPSRVAFTKAERRHLATLDLVIWVTDKDRNDIGGVSDRIDLQLTDASYAKLMKQHIVFTRRIPVTGKPFDIRAAVYDYDNDRVGAVSKRIQ